MLMSTEFKRCVTWFIYFLPSFIIVAHVWQILDPIIIKIDEKPYKNIFVYYTGYVIIKDLKFVKINSVNPLYLIFSKINGYFEEINGNKCSALVLTNESKEVTKIKIWTIIKQNQKFN